MRPPRQMTQLEKAREMSSRWSPFPNTSTQGAYVHFSQVIELPSVAPAEFTLAGQNDYSARRRVLPLLAHEAQHLIDHVSSLWGRENLVRIFNAFNVRKQGPRTEFGRVTELLRELRSLHLNDYYTEYWPAAWQPWNGKPWKYEHTCGFRLDETGHERPDYPVVFTRFSTDSDDDVARVPFTVASLLEVNAMAAEINRTLTVIDECPDPNGKLIERSSWERELEQMMYNAVYGVYAVAAHYFSNVTGAKGIVEVYQKASYVATFCLNVPRALFSNLRIPRRFEPWGDRNKALRRRGDRGYLYMVLVEHGRNVPTVNMNEWLEAVSVAAGLGTPAKVAERADRESQVVANGALDGPARERLKDVLDLGLTYRTTTPPWPVGALQLPSVPLPPILLADGKFINSPGGITSGTFANSDKWLDEAHEYYLLLQEFIDGCVV